jgi:hypothetical protein
MKASAILILCASIVAAATPAQAERRSKQPTPPPRACLEICAGPDYECPEGTVLEQEGVSSLEITSKPSSIKC